MPKNVEVTTPMIRIALRIDDGRIIAIEDLPRLLRSIR
jgi:hypothetical protein